MFAVYSSSGKVFSGTLERLRRVEKTASSTPHGQTSMTELELEERNNTAVMQSQVNSYTASQAATQNYLDLLRNEGQRDPVYHAHQVMSSPIITLQSNSSLNKALATFQKHTFQVIPIVNHYQQLVGLLSRRQLYEYMLDGSHVNHQATQPPRTQTFTEQSIGEVFLNAHSRVYSADPITDIRRIATLLVEKRLDALPICNDADQILGIVSRTDILKCAINDPPLSLWC